MKALRAPTVFRVISIDIETEAERVALRVALEGAIHRLVQHGQRTGAIDLQVLLDLIPKD